MQALKSLVIGLGILIIVSIGLLGWGYYQKLATPHGATDAAAGAAAGSPQPPASVAAFGDIRLSLPAGCGITEMQPSGDRLFLRLGPSGPCERVVVLDVRSGAILGSVLLAP